MFLRQRCAAPPQLIFMTGGAPPPTKIDRRAAADTMTSAQGSRHDASLLHGNAMFCKQLLHCNCCLTFVKLHLKTKTHQCHAQPEPTLINSYRSVCVCRLLVVLNLKQLFLQ